MRLRVLSLQAGRVVTTGTLLRKVWGRRGADDNDRVRTVVNKLRAKLGDDAANAAYVFTQREVGYKVGDPGPVSAARIDIAAQSVHP